MVAHEPQLIGAPLGGIGQTGHRDDRHVRRPRRQHGGQPVAGHLAAGDLQVVGGQQHRHVARHGPGRRGRHGQVVLGGRAIGDASDAHTGRDQQDRGRSGADDGPHPGTATRPHRVKTGHRAAATRPVAGNGVAGGVVVIVSGSTGAVPPRPGGHLGEDAGPQRGRGSGVEAGDGDHVRGDLLRGRDVREHRRALLLRRVDQRLLEGLGLARGQGVQGVQVEIGGVDAARGLRMIVMASHANAPPRQPFSRRSPSRMRDLTVGRAAPSRSATSR